jgi:hypothetical protein
MSVQTLIFSRSEKHLMSYRQQAAHVEAELKEEYASFLPQIQECYKSAAYWHGTGRYRYHHPDDSRYEGVHTATVVDVLNSIIEQHALTGHPDLWLQEGGKTVSVAPSRMHARLYAHIHLREGVWLKYVFGGTRFWMSLFFILAVWDFMSEFNRGKWQFVRKTLLSRLFLKHARTWASSVRHLDSGLLPFWRAYDLRSDIPTNHAMLFGIKKSAAEGAGTLPFFQWAETRVPGGISLEYFSHVEVPKENLAQVKSLFAEKNITLPVIPLEFGELYCSRISLADLVHAHV